ncbi:MAG: SDR family NAD(P)-dependent oxidoreductase, partial [Fibrobacter sp.]|nr:SDR family NAD(P)-dependent oxidoreductase [Fibrobacter sp.]
MSDKKQVLVTGASGGIGSAIAEAVAQAGYAVVANYNRGKAKADELV